MLAISFYGTLTNNTDPDQTHQSAASDQSIQRFADTSETKTNIYLVTVQLNN